MVRAFAGIAFACLLSLAGCANVPVAPQLSQLPWRDNAFGYDAVLVTGGKEDLFRLDAELLALLKRSELLATSPQHRLKHLMSLGAAAATRRGAWRSGGRSNSYATPVVRGAGAHGRGAAP